MTKPCTKCGEDKPLDEYYVKREGGRERLASHCKVCHAEVARAWQASNREKVRKLRRGYDAGLSGVRRRDQLRAWRAANPDKTAAHAAVRRAVKSGHLARPSVCSECAAEPGLGHDGRSLLEAHHEDYARPLDVAWLCPSCHKASHAGVGSD